MYIKRRLYLIFIIGIFSQISGEQKLNHKQIKDYIDCVGHELCEKGDHTTISDIYAIKWKVNDSLPWSSSLSAKEIDNRFVIAIINFVKNKSYIYAVQKTKDCAYAAEVAAHLKNKMEKTINNRKKEPEELLPFLGKSLETTVDKLCKNYKPGSKPEFGNQHLGN